ncbi:MAG: ABC transporter, partial [Symploca sp. SIO2B6]|nr:ABC transporter [Symploca sp. SIO2B6]
MNHTRYSKRRTIRFITWKTPLAWLQLTYKKSRFLMAALGIASAILLMFVQFGFLGALYESNTMFHRHLRGDLVMLHASTETMVLSTSFSRRRLYQMLSFEEVEAVSPIYQETGNFKSLHDGRTRTILVVGINPQVQPFEFPELDRDINQIHLTDTFLFDRYSRPEYGPVAINFDAGKEILAEVNGQRIKIGGVVNFTGTSFGVTGNLITSEFNFERLFENRRNIEQISMGMIRLRPGVDPEAIAAQMQQHLPTDVKIITPDAFAQIEREYWQKTTAIGFVFQMGAAVGFLIGIYIIYQVLLTDISEHIPNYALLKAKGYQARYFWGVLIQEALILSIASYIPGYLLAIALYKLVHVGTLLPIF